MPLSFKLRLRTERPRHRRAWRKRRAFARRVEQLEDRTVPSIFAVNGTGDNADATPLGDGIVDVDLATPGPQITLRAAIQEANALAGPDVIEFNIPDTDPNFDGSIFVIQPLSGLPALNDNTGGTTIDGRTQTMFGGDTNPAGPEIVLDGSLLTTNFRDGISIRSDGNRVFGLNIHSFPDEGIQIASGGANNWIAANYIGTDPTGSVGLGNGTGTGGTRSGILITSSATGNLIGTNGDGVEDDLEGNVISANTNAGVSISTDNNVVAGNLIGTDGTGSVAIANGSDGVTIFGGATDNLIGTDGDGTADAAERNIISGNNGQGILITGLGTDENVVAGNYIGTDVTGTSDLGNGRLGVRIQGGASDNLIGTDGDGLADDAERNIVSGNDGSGIRITGGGTHSNVVAGNHIGTDVSGTVALGNTFSGVAVSGGARLTVIGTDGDGIADVAERNVISGNQVQDGVRIEGSGTSDNVVAGNLIGTDANGTAALGNGTAGNDSGVFIRGGAQSNRIGTNGDGVADAAERNIISGNLRGVAIDDSGSTQNVVAGNFIGTDITGSTALPNQGTGVTVFLAENNTIGTDGDGIADAAERNVISGNAAEGITLNRAIDNVVAGNFIGTDVSGAAALPNSGAGIRSVGGASSNLIGTDGDGVADTDERNIISGNDGAGVLIRNVGSDGNVVAGNFIGTDVTGTLALGNDGQGVRIAQGAQFNIVGTNGDGTGDSSEGNLISGNGREGVRIAGDGTENNRVAGNLVGLDVSGDTALSNGQEGVQLDRGARFNIIGTNGDGVSDAAERNVIAGNVVSFGESEVFLFDAHDNRVSGNFVGTDSTGSKAVSSGAVIEGIRLRFGSSSNIIGTNGDGVADEAERNVISGNEAAGVVIAQAGSDDNVVAGNYIGTDATGTSALGNGLSGGFLSAGVLINGGPRNNLIGTDGDGVSDAAERNLVSGNVGNGVWISSADENTVAGNFIGTDVAGTAALGNTRFAGVILTFGAQFNVIGTDADGMADAAERNIISGNAGNGVAVGLRSDQNLVAGNFIGTDVSGTASVGNGLNGVRIAGGATDNLIGTDGDGTADAAEGNTIAFNAGAGVFVASPAATGNTIRRNSIHSNGELGIDLAGGTEDAFGVTANDAADGDAGPNNLQNFPVLSEVDAGANTRVVGALNSTANTTFTIEVYANTAADPSGHGEGDRFLGHFMVTTNASGDASFNEVLAAATTGGEFITATATGPNGNTSEFSGPDPEGFPVRAILPVEIDVKPGSDLNPINVGSNGVIAVSILTTDSFDASTVDVDTVFFAEAPAIHSALEDIDSDGDLDLILHFRTQETNLREVYEALFTADPDHSARQQTSALLTGATTDGELFDGFDTLDLLLSGKERRALLEELAAA